MQADWTSICAETDSTLQPVFSESEERGSDGNGGGDYGFDHAEQFARFLLNLVYSGR